MRKSFLRRINPSKSHNEKRAGWMNQEVKSVLEPFCLLGEGSEWGVGCCGREFDRVMLVMMCVYRLSFDAFQNWPNN